MASKESGLQMLARLGQRPTLSGLEEAIFGSGPQPKDVIEIYGREGTGMWCGGRFQERIRARLKGKTELLVHLIVRCILPNYWENVHLAGHNAGVLLIDTEMKVSIFRIVHLMEKYIVGKLSDSGVSGKSSEDIEKFIKECLVKLHVFQCPDSERFLITLHSLEGLLCNDPNISTIMIDSITAFYWIDRMNNEDNVQETTLKYAAEILSKLVHTYSLVLFATKYELFKKKSAGSFADAGKACGAVRDNLTEDLEQYHAEFMSWTWRKLVSHRLILVQDKPLKAGHDDSTVTEEGQSSEGKQSFVIGGDCANGNKRFFVSQFGIDFQ